MITHGYLMEAVQQGQPGCPLCMGAVLSVMNVLGECNQLAQKRIYFGDPYPPIETVIGEGRVSKFLFQFLIEVKIFDKL